MLLRTHNISRIHHNVIDSFLRISWKLRSTIVYMHRKQLFKMLVSVTYFKIIEIGEEVAFLLFLLAFLFC